jgi:hypothetical protein
MVLFNKSISIIELNEKFFRLHNLVKYTFTVYINKKLIAVIVSNGSTIYSVD